MDADLALIPQTLQLSASKVSKGIQIRHAVFLSSRYANLTLPEGPILRGFLRDTLLGLAGGGDSLAFRSPLGPSWI